MKIQVERWAKFYPDCLVLFAEHKAEIGESSEHMPLDPDFAKCAVLDKCDMAQVMTARDDDNKLVGYCVFIIDNSIESKNVLVGEQKFWFVTKSARKGALGIRLFMNSLELMKKKGVKNVYPHMWVRAGEKEVLTLDKFFIGLGAYELERIYSLWIGDK